MPTYTYRCRGCGHKFEVIQKISDAPVTACELCGEAVSRVFHPAGIIFKGSGFYTTDYKKAPAKPVEGNGQKPKKETAAKPEPTAE